MMLLTAVVSRFQSEQPRQRPECAALVLCVIVHGCGVQEARERLGVCSEMTQISRCPDPVPNTGTGLPRGTCPLGISRGANT